MPLLYGLRYFEGNVATVLSHVLAALSKLVAEVILRHTTFLENQNQHGFGAGIHTNVP